MLHSSHYTCGGQGTSEATLRYHQYHKLLLRLNTEVFSLCILPGFLVAVESISTEIAYESNFLQILGSNYKCQFYSWLLNNINSSVQEIGLLLSIF